MEGGGVDAAAYAENESLMPGHDVEDRLVVSTPKCVPRPGRDPLLRSSRV